MQDLEYTKLVNKRVEEYEKKLYEETVLDVYQLLGNGKLGIEDVLWYHAYEAFTYLCSVPLRNEQAAAEIRRYIFKELLGGNQKIETYRDENGMQAVTTKYYIGEVIYDSLTEPNIIEKMVKVLQKCYTKRNVLVDEGVADGIPITPSKLRKLLLQASMERRTMIRLGFAMGMSKEELNKLLRSGAFFRELSVAVPFELIVLYCIENGYDDWTFVNKLSQIADSYCEDAKEALKQKKKTIDEDKIKFLYTKDSQARWEKRLSGMELEEFKDKILKPCCRASIYKEDSAQKQYSKEAFELMLEKSILRDKDKGNAVLPVAYNTPYLKSTVVRYVNTFGLSEEYGLPVKMRSDSEVILSQDLYCRFLSYRVMKPNPIRSRSTKIYSMEYGGLPKEITQNLLKYSEMISMPNLPHRIDRHDILIVLFLHFLMERWKAPSKSFLVRSQKEADALWRDFLSEANADLKSVGYAKISSKNPLDALLRFSCKSLSPLECYTRVYELNVLFSLCKDEKGYSEVIYPPYKRILETIDGLLQSYENLAKAEPNLEERRKEVVAFCDMVRSRIT